MATVHRTQQLLLNAVDRLGRPIEPCVLSVAQEMAPQALSYAENFIGETMRLRVHRILNDRELTAEILSL